MIHSLGVVVMSTVALVPFVAALRIAIKSCRVVYRLGLGTIGMFGVFWVAIR
jgi:hypothetical protein